MNITNRTSLEVDKKMRELTHEKVGYYWEGESYNEADENVIFPTLEVFLYQSEEHLNKRKASLIKKLRVFGLPYEQGSVFTELLDQKSNYSRLGIVFDFKAVTLTELELMIKTLGVYGHYEWEDTYLYNQTL